MAKNNKKSSEKVNDVSKPGETPVSSNARPTITGHSPIIKNDPMVSSSSKDEQQEENKENDKKEAYSAKSKTKINPISEDLKTDEKSEDEKPAREAGVEDSAEKPDAVSSDSAAIDAVAQTADAKKAESKEAEEDQKHKEYVDELVKSGKYRLPIIEGGHKGSAERVVSWLFLILLLASIGVYLAIDAGYIKIGFDLPFEFIKG